jgi:hypothetical protein
MTVAVGSRFDMSVLEAVGQECDEPSALRQNVYRGSTAGVQPQLATVVGVPAVVQIQGGGNRAHITANETVEMTRVAGTARIEREVSLEILESGHEPAVERGTQLVEPRQDALFGIALRMLQPGDEVAAHFRSELRFVSAPHSRRPQGAGLVQFDAARAKLREQCGVDEIIDHAEPGFRELIDQARRRDRSPRCFAAGRRDLRASTGLWRLAAGFLRFFFGAGSSIEPRHLGEPQRQA